MTLISVAKTVCRRVGIADPDIIAASTERKYVEILELANEMALRIARGYDWQDFSRVETMQGDGVTESFDLPGDYDRMPKKANVWSSRLQGPLNHINDLDEWLGLEVLAFDLAVNSWTMFDGKIHIKPVFAAGETGKYRYQHNQIIRGSNGTLKTKFTADDDSFVLDEQLLQLGMIWQWRANKGQPYAEDMVNYETLLGRLVSRNKGSKIIASGHPRLPRGTRVAYPCPLT